MSNVRKSYRASVYHRRGGTEEAGQQKPQQAAAGKGEQPGEGDAGSHTVVDRPPPAEPAPRMAAVLA